MKSIFKNFGGSIAITLLCFGLAGWWGIRGPLGPWTAIWLVAVLSVLEVSLSFDNAVVNAKVLKDMTAFWRATFLTAGMIVAVFGMRLVFPIVIVAVSADISMATTVSMALNSPE